MVSLNTYSPIDWTIDADAFETLRSQFAGRLILPSDPEYDQERGLWNGMIDKRPALIAQVAGVADVIQAVRFAQANGLKVAVRGGGHNVAGHAMSHGGLTIDLKNMNSVHVDPLRRIARVQGGAILADVDRETGAFGLAVPAGVISTTGVGGLTLGGGIGWLVGKHGMTIDNLLSIDVVDANGDLLHASEETNPDLFWALRGGGGNFGIATMFEYRLHPVTDVLAGMVAWPLDQARDALALYRDFTASNPEIMTTYAMILNHPENGLPIVAIAPCYPGDVEEGKRVVEPLRNYGSPVADLIDVMPFSVWQQANDFLFPIGRHYYWKSSLMVDLSDDLLEAVAAFGETRPTPNCTIAFEHFRGPMNRVPSDATAFPHRQTQYQTVVNGGSDDPERDADVIQWVRGLYAAMEKHAINASFLNFNSVEQGDTARRVYAGLGPNLERLVEVKRRYDPTNFFAGNNNITPE